MKASLRAKAAKSSIAPSAARLGFFDQKLPTSAIPTERQISRSRSSITSQTRIDAPGESPAELSEMVDSMVRRNGSCPSTVYTLPDFSKVDEKKTIVPFTCDVMLAAAQKYIAQGVSAHNGSHTRVIRLVGDATHDESFQKLKVLKIGLAGCHFERGEWKTTMIPVIQCICHQETKEVVDLTLTALIHLLQQRHGINLVDFVGEWFWDGDQGAMSSLTSLFPDARGHLCLEHAKRNAEKRYKDGYKNVVRHFLEFSAFMSPGAFTVSVDLFLESLLDGNQDTV